jgi:histidinol-phosphate aminotransferase
MSTNDDAKRPSAVDLLRPAVRAMPGYTPGEQISDLVKLNTNEGAFPPSPRVMATVAAIADETLRLYPDPVSLRLRAAAATRFGVGVDQILAGNGSDDCLTILYRGFLDAGDRIACPWPTYGLYDTLATLQGAELAREDDHPRQPEQPVGHAGSGRRAAPCV